METIILISVFVLISFVWILFVLNKFNKNPSSKKQAITGPQEPLVNSKFTITFPDDLTEEEIKEIADHYIEFNNQLKIISKKSRSKEEIISSSALTPKPKNPTDKTKKPASQTDNKSQELKTDKTGKKELNLHAENTNENNNTPEKPEDVLGDKFNY